MSTLWQVPAVVITVLAWLIAPPEGLGDLAKREALRRQATQKSSASLTNLGLPIETVPVSAVTLPPGEVPPPVDPEARPPATATTGTATEKPADQSRDESWWRTKMRDARLAVERGQIAADALQSRINALQADSVNIDDPIKQARARNDLGKALDELDRVRKQTESDRKVIAALQDEARRLNVPAGWLR